MQRIATLGEARRSTAAAEAERDYDRRRRDESETRRNYGMQRWKRVRASQLAAFPLCARCESHGRVTAATVCDHVFPHRGDLDVFWNGPFQSLCAPCHDSAKQSEEQDRVQWHPLWIEPSRVPLTVVCGAPGSGKTTWVRDRAGPRDMVLDLDVIIGEVIRPDEQRLDALTRAVRERNRRLALLTRDGAQAQWPAAWLIVAEPKAEWRQFWVERMKAREVVVMNVPTEECARRIAVRDGGSRIAARRLPEQWWRDYRPRAGDTVVAAA